MKSRTHAAPAAILALVLGGCATTEFTSTWKAPDAGPLNLRGQKVAAFVVAPNDSTSRAGESALARELTARGAEGVPGYGVVPKEERSSNERVKARLEGAGIVAAVVLRPVAKDKELNYTPGTTYWGGPGYGGGFYGYWGGAYSSPGYVTTDTIITVETLIYDLRADKLVWAGMSETTNPEKVDAFVTELVVAAAKELQKQGLIAPSGN